MGSIWNVGVGRRHLAAAEGISLGLSFCGALSDSRAGGVLSGAISGPILEVLQLTNNQLVAKPTQ